MQQYLEVLQTVIPKNITVYANSFLSTMNIIEAIKNKFYPEYKEMKDAQNYETNLQQQYSTIFKGSHQLETQKRTSFNIKQKGYKEVKEFLKKINFNQVLNTDRILGHFFQIDLQCCLIELSQISSDQPEYFQLIQNDVNEYDLNKCIDELGLLFFEYFRGQYKKNNIFEEYIVSLGEIQNFVYKKIKKAAKSKKTTLYNKLISKLNDYISSEKLNSQLIELCQSIQEQRFQINITKILIDQFYQERKLYFDDYVKNVYGFQISRVILLDYFNNIREYYLQQIMGSFITYTNMDNEIYFDNLKEKIELYFLQFISIKQHNGGIMDAKINTNLQYLIYSIDWIQSSDEADSALELINYLSQFNGNVSQSESQIMFKEQQFSIQILYDFKFHNQQKCEQASIWWDQNISEDQNILIIFQLYTLFAGIAFENDQFIFGIYTPSQRIALTQILRVLNNGKYHYINQTLMKICEQTTFNIQQQLFQQIEINMNQNNNISNQENYSIILQGIVESIQLPLQKFTSTDLYKQLYFLKLIMKPIDRTKKNIVQQLKDNQHNFIQYQLNNIYQTEQNTIKIQPPENLYFEVLSDDTANSNIITFVISGFISKDDHKIEYWNHLLKNGCGTVIALHWNCSELNDFGVLLAKNIIPQLLTKANFVTAAFSTLTAVINNPYEKAHQQAIKVGKYLPYLITKCKLFGDYQINIVCHSLGCQIVLETIKILDKLYENDKRQYINQILIMGGVADVRKLQKRRWNSVAGSIHNVYIKNDGVLNYLLKVAKIFDKPCGTQSIILGYKKVINCDLTGIIKGHTDYKDRLAEILVLSDFNNDFKYLTENIKELF